MVYILKLETLRILAIIDFRYNFARNIIQKGIIILFFSELMSNKAELNIRTGETNKFRRLCHIN